MGVISEKIGQLADSIDNAIAARQLPLPPAMHLEQSERMMRDWSKQLKEIYVAMTGENPWPEN